MKKILMAALAVMLTTGLYAQNALFAVKKGMVLTYRDSDAQGKTSGYSVMTIKDVKGSGKNMSVIYGLLMLDNNRKTPKNSPGEQTFTVEVKNDVVFLDLNQLVPAEIKQQGLKVEVSGIPMELPGSLQAGQKLKDANVTMKMDLGIMKMNTVLKMTDGKCLAVENVTVPAGTFKSHKITQTVTTAAAGINTVTRTVSWYAPAVGTVKTEVYDSKDKLSSSSVLVELKGK
ncbi:MAG: hypothetical protein LBB81_09680 [Treponema sp.]|jgi:hypothetical protein|nr:hypothetical protein [Treponema sp.]